MNKDLTQSNIERQNILNNRMAVEKIADTLEISGMLFDGEYRFTKQMVADFYDVDERTIERCVEQNLEELKHNGYVLSKGKQLKEFKLQFAHVINVGSKTTQLALFNFRSFLNIGMLLTESEKAKQLRSAILDIVIGCINEKTGGGTKYINRRDVNYLSAAVTENNYRKTLTMSIMDSRRRTLKGFTPNSLIRMTQQASTLLITLVLFQFLLRWYRNCKTLSMPKVLKLKSLKIK